MTMTHDPPKHPRPKGVARRAVRVGLISSLVISVGLGYLVYHDLTSPERIGAMARQYLQSFAEGEVSIGAAEFTWWDGIRLHDVSVADPAAPNDPEAAAAPPIFRCAELQLHHDPWSMLTRRWRIRSVVAREPSCRVVRSVVNGHTTLNGFLKTQLPSPGKDRFDWPSVELRDATLRMIHREEAGDRLVEEIALSVRGVPVEGALRQYDIVWKSEDARDAKGRARLHLTSGHLENVRGGLPWISLESVIVAVSTRSRQAAHWCDLLGLDGSMRVRDYHLNLGSAVAHPASALIELNNASLSIPVNDEEKPLLPHRRYLRFARVRGTISVTAEALTADFEGLLHGSRCHVNATLGAGMTSFGSLDEIAFTVDASLSGFRLPRIGPDAPEDEDRFVHQWARFSKFYANYDPHGIVDISIAVSKEAGAGASLKLSSLLIDGQGADAQCRWFPYRVHDIHGRVEYRPEGVFLRGITGRHGEGRIAVDAFMAQAKPWTAVELAAVGTNIPIEHDLIVALPARFRQAHKTLTPSGTLDVMLDLSRPPGVHRKPARWETHVALGFTNLSACHEEFPYPLSGLLGDVLIDPGSVQVADVSCTHDGATIEVDGVLGFSDAGTQSLHLDIEGRHVPIDRRLLTALPSKLRGDVSAYAPEGRIGVKTTFDLGPGAGDVTYTAVVTPEAATARPNFFPVSIQDVGGSLTLTQDLVTLDALEGRYGAGRIRADGTIRRRNGKNELNVSVKGTDVLLDDPLQSAAPQRLRRLLSTWQVEGPIGFETTLRTPAGASGGSMAMASVVTLDGVTVRHARSPEPFEQVRATLLLDDQSTQSRGITARYAGAEIAAEFSAASETVSGESRSAGSVSLTAKGVHLDESIRDWLPPSLRDAWNRRNPTGTVDVSIDRLEFLAGLSDTRLAWTVNGVIDLHDVGLGGPATVSDLNGRMTLHGPVLDRDGGCMLAGEISARSAGLFGWPVRDAEAGWVLARLADGTGQFTISDISGATHGGALSGRLDLRFDDAGSDYSLTTTLHDVDVALMLAADAPAVSSEPDIGTAPRPKGRMAAHLYLTGDPSVPDSRRGGGHVEIMGGDLYRVPFVLAVLKVLNLTVPREEAVQNAEAEFFVVGSRVELKDILLLGRGLALSGSGEMMLPDRRVDISLASVSPHAWMRTPALSRMVEEASRNLVELHIVGPITNPLVKARPFRSLQDELKKLFKKKKATKKTVRAS